MSDERKIVALQQRISDLEDSLLALDKVCRLQRGEIAELKAALQHEITVGDASDE